MKKVQNLFMFKFSEKTCRLAHEFIIFKAYLSAEDMGSVGVPREKNR